VRSRRASTALFFFEPFLDNWESTWKVSRDEEFSGRWKHEAYANDALIPGDKGLVVGDPARKHAVSTLFKEAFVPGKDGLVVQYELQLKNGLQCGGAYLKLLSASEALDADGFKAETPYTIMFGPDRCGSTNKVHFILRHKNPKTGEIEEKHLVAPPTPIVDKETHLYTAIVGTDSSVKILVDNKELKTASLLTDADFEPSVNPPKEIDDPKDEKPSNWIDDAMMPEPGASKPDDWDEDAPVQIEDPEKSKPADWLDDAPEMIPDGAAVRPDDWDEDEDGEWEAPLIANPDCKAHGCGEWKAPMVSNPAYKGKWHAKMINNPDYIGVWQPKRIPNPDFEAAHDPKPHAMSPIGGIGIELWTMQDGILFDNILISADPEVASNLAAKTFVLRKEAESALRKSEERDYSREPGAMGTVKYYARTAYYYMLDNPWVVVGTVCLGLLPLIFFCCCYGGKSNDEDEQEEPEPAPEPPKAAPKAAAKAVPKATSQEEEPKSAEEPKAGGSTTKKRTKKADS